MTYVSTFLSNDLPAFAAHHPILAVIAGGLVLVCFLIGIVSAVQSLSSQSNAASTSTLTPVDRVSQIGQTYRQQMKQTSDRYKQDIRSTTRR